MKKVITAIMVFSFAFVAVIGYVAATKTKSDRDKLIEWRTGVWLSAGGTYTIYTPEHYFVLMMAGDTTDPNLYYGCSQVSYHEKGMTRHQVQRLRKFPGRDMTMFVENTLTDNDTEIPYTPDTTLFDPTTCVTKDGVIYDAIIECTDSYVLLMSCNGDKIKIFNDGKAAYLPAGGGEFYSYRVEKL